MTTSFVTLQRGEIFANFKFVIEHPSTMKIFVQSQQRLDNERKSDEFHIQDDDIQFVALWYNCEKFSIDRATDN